jgi:hypothetical protein
MLLLAGMPGLQVLAGGFNPSVSLFGGYTYAREVVIVSSGDFSFKHNNFNWGFELSNEFFLKNYFFLKTGLRYQQFKTTVYANNPIQTISWIKHYETIAVPVLFGKHFYSGNGRMGAVYFGGSFGIIATPTVYSESTYFLTRYGGGGSEAHWDERDSIDASPGTFFPTIDIGADYHLFKSPRLSLGLLFSFQLNQTQSYSCTSTVQVTNTGERYDQYIQLAHQFFNCSMMFSYRFGKKSKMPEPRLMLDWGAPK